MTQIVEVPGYGQVEFPDGMSDADIGLAIRKNLLRQDAPKRESTPQERFVASPMGRFAAGVATPVAGLAQMAVEPFMGGDSNPVTSRLRQLQEMQKAGGHEGWDIAGGVGQVIGPMGVAGKIPQAASLVGRIAQGAGIGAGTAMTQPVMEGDVFGAKPGQAVSGGVLGAAIPPLTAAAGKVWQTGKNVVQSFNPELVERKIIDAAAGPKRAEIIQALQNPQIVPGTQVGAGEAAAPAGRAEFSALQRNLEPLLPSAYRDMRQASDAARVGAVQSVGKDKAALDTAEAARDAAAKANYAAAGQGKVKSDASLETLLSRPSMEKVEARAASLAEERGQPFVFGKTTPATTQPGLLVGQSGQPLTQTTTPAKFAEYPVNSLHYMKMAMDDLIKNPERFGIGNSERGAILKTRNELTHWIAKKSPEYDFARAEHARLSTPINQMQVGQALENKLTSPVDGANLRAHGFSEALRNPTALLNKSTHWKGNEQLSDVLNPQQVGKMTSVADDLSRRAQYEDLGQKGSAAALDIMGAAVPKAPPTYILQPEITLTRAIINRMQGKLSEKAMQGLAVRMQDPQEILKIMNSLPPQQRAQVMQDFMQQMGRAGAVSGGAAQ
jgi:hypothetical protein